MRDRKDNKGRNNINKKDHQLKFEPSTDSNSNKAEDKIENKAESKNRIK